MLVDPIGGHLANDIEELVIVEETLLCQRSALDLGQDRLDLLGLGVVDPLPAEPDRYRVEPLPFAERDLAIGLTYQLRPIQERFEQIVANVVDPGGDDPRLHIVEHITRYSAVGGLADTGDPPPDGRSR